MFLKAPKDLRKMSRTSWIDKFNKSLRFINIQNFFFN